jgi:hypothetical protein
MMQLDGETKNNFNWYRPLEYQQLGLFMGLQVRMYKSNRHVLEQRS